MRHVEFLDAEIAEVERLIARQMLSCSDARRLMSVPGVNVICAASFLAAIGDIRRFKTSRQLAAYLGLDPKVRQSGSARRSGRISKQGSPQRAGRWSRPRSAPCASPARCTRSTSACAPAAARIAIVAAARKLACCSVPAHPRGAIRPPAAIADRQEAPPAGAHRRREALRHQRRRHVVNQRGDARRRTQARARGRGLLRADGPRLAGNCATKGSGRERDTGARITGPRRATSRGRPRAPRRLRFDTSSTRAHPHPTTPTDRPPTAGNRRRQTPRALETAELRRSSITRPNRRHRSRSAALGAAPASDPPREIAPKVDPGPLDFHPSSEGAVGVSSIRASTRPSAAAPSS